ncbi:MAG: AlkZ-related protein [Actinomycetota bacterium]
MAAAPTDLEAARAHRWWHTRRRVGSTERAAAFIDDVGFALLFPTAGVALPSLLETVRDRTYEHVGVEWGPDVERVWGWKDELPRRGRAGVGKVVRGRASFLSPALLADLDPRDGRPDDFTEPPLSADAARIARILLRSGPQSTAALREATGVESKRGSERFANAVTELGRALVVTHLGTEDEGAGWPSAVLELTARAFPIPKRRNRDAARLRAARTFLDTMISARPHELGNAFGWGAAAARASLDRLVSGGEAVKDGSAYGSVSESRVGSPSGSGGGSP